MFVFLLAFVAKDLMFKTFSKHKKQLLLDTGDQWGKEQRCSNWIWNLQTRANLLGMWWLGTVLAAMSMEIRTLRRANGWKCRPTTLDFRRTDFGLFRDLFGRMPWDMAMQRRETQESLLIFKGHILWTQEWSIPSGRNQGKGVRRHARMRKKFPTKLRDRKEVYKRWKQEQEIQEKYQDAAWSGKDKVRKHKAQVELNLASDVNGNKKGFYNGITSRRK